MKQNFEFRNEAFDLLKNNWKEPVLLYLIISAISVAATFIVPNVANLAITILLVYPCAYLFSMQLMSFVREGKSNLTSDFFQLFKEKYGIALPVMSLVFLYIFLWTLLFFIPGIIKGYSYALTQYISIDNQELKADECINQSIRMMNGNKWRLFLLDLSFIGWYLLAIFLTLGIGLLWVAPYHETARILFYEDLKNQPQLVEE